MRAFIYCRVSTREQNTEDHYSLEGQEQRCRDYVKMKKWHVTKGRKDVASGKSDAREGFQELLQEVREGRVDVVLVYRLDRLSRNVRDIYDFLDQIRASDVAFVSVTEGFDTSTAVGRAMLGVAAVFAQLTREMISENTRDGLQRRAEGGLYNGNPTALFGYDYDRATATLSINEAEAEVVRQIFDWFTEHKLGTEKITRLLNLAGHRPRSGGQWSQVTIRQMLRNPVYCGDVRLNGGVTEGRQSAIVTREQFEAAQAIIRSRAMLPPRSHQSQHLLSAIATCGTCERRLRVHYIYQKKADGSRVQRVFYKHSSNVQVGERACDGIARSAPHLEAAILEKIADASRTRELDRLAFAEVKSRESKKRVPLMKEKDRLLLELAELGDKFTQWADRLDSGRIDEEQFAVQNQRLLQRKAELQKRLSGLDEELEAEQTLEVTLAEIRKALDSFPEVWETLTLEERREMLRLLVEYLKVYPTYAELKLVFLGPMQISTDFRHGKRPRLSQASAAAVPDFAGILSDDADSGRGIG